MSVTETSSGEPVPDRLPIGRSTLPRRAGWLLIGLVVVTVGTAMAMLLVEDRLVVGGLGFLLMLALVLLRTPIAVALLGPALLGVYAIGGERMLSSLAGRTPYAAIASWSLSVLPMFILMGLLVSSTGIAANLFTAARQWLRWLPGGLAVGTNVAGAGLAAVSGSTIGSSYALARVGMPEMLRAGYDKRVAITAVLAAGLPGQLIPPSILLVIYAGLVQAPVGPQLVAGVVPGIAIAVLSAVTLFGLAVFARRRAGETGSEPAVGLRTMLRSASAAWPVPVLILIIVGGMASGLFTATEAGAGAALVAMLLAIWIAWRKREWKPLGDGLAETVQSVGMIFLLVVGATFLTEMFSLTGASAVFQGWVVDAGFNRVTFLLVMVVVYLLLGMAMDTLAMMLLTIPVLLPTLESLDIPLIFFGVFVVLLAEVGMLTPPVGMLTFVLHSIFQDPRVNLGQRISLRDVFVSVGFVLPGVLLLLLLMIAFPDLVMFLPDALTTAETP